MKKRLFLLFLLILVSNLYAITPLIIYRPENNHPLNEIRCYIKIEDENGNDVTYTCGNGFYSWTNMPNRYFAYKKKYYLSGGMAFHININNGKYKITVYTPKEDQQNFECENKSQWNSNTFEYDTENPINVIFVVPTVNENQFYNGGWYIDYKAPKFFKFTIPKQNTDSTTQNKSN